MRPTVRNSMSMLVVLAAGTTLITPAVAGVVIQCPGDTNQDAVIDLPDPSHPNARCAHLAAGDGFITMADGKLQYIFGYADVTGVPANGPLGDGQGGVMQVGTLASTFPAPTIALNEGEEFYLTLTNVGMIMRPDLFDPHSVHFHGFPNAAPVFDGEPESSLGLNMGTSITYYYNVVEPGTYMYHCHVQATEHMQMGMLGNLYVSPKQNGTSFTYQGKNYTKFVYNDGDGSTGYDVEFPIQLSSFDSVFHDQNITLQPLPFSDMKDDYAMMNGRGYPDTVNPNPLTPPAETNGVASQPLGSLIQAIAGQKVLLRLSNLSVTNFYTVTALGLPMKVVGRGASLLRGPTGKSLYYETASVTLGGGEAADVLIDTTGVTPGTYFLYTTNLNYLSNGDEDYGGMMTEIRIN